MRIVLIWLMLAAVLSRAGLHAQGLPEVVVLGHAGKRTGVLRQLHLTPAQVVRINTLIDENKAQRKQRLTHRPDETEHARRLAQEADFETKIQAVLSPEQRDKYQELRGLKPTRPLPEMRVPGQ